MYDKDTGRLTYEDAVQITSKDENTAKGDALVMLEEGGLDDEEYEIFKVRPISQDYQKQLYGAETFGADDEKVTEGDTELWLGSSNTVSEAVEVITSVANGEYKPKNLKEDILDYKVMMYGAEDEGRFYDELEEKIEAKGN